MSEKSLGDRWIDALLISEHLRKVSPQAYAKMWAEWKSRCADSTEQGDRPAGLGTSEERERATFLNSFRKHGACGGFSFPEHRPTAAIEPPLPPTVDPTTIDGYVPGFYFSVRFTIGPHLRSADNANAKEPAKVEPKRCPDTRRDHVLAHDRCLIRHIQKNHD